MSSTTLGLSNDGINMSCRSELKTIKTTRAKAQLFPKAALKLRNANCGQCNYGQCNYGQCNYGQCNYGQSTGINTESIVSQVYNPMNLAAAICKNFENHQSALITAFVNDRGIFRYLYEFLPKDITVGVLNQIPLEDAIDIVERHQTPVFIYDQVDPVLYVVRFFSDSKISNLHNKDPHCIEFKKNLIPENSALELVLRCKQYLEKDDFTNLVKMLCN